jgi:hypothetical protein
MSFSFVDCHTECIRTDDFRAMYLVDGDAYDIDKINNAIGDGAKKETEKIDSESFIFSSKWYFIFEYIQ